MTPGGGPAGRLGVIALLGLIVLTRANGVAAGPRAVRAEGELLASVERLDRPDEVFGLIRAIRARSEVEARLRDALVHLAVTRAALRVRAAGDPPRLLGHLLTLALPAATRAAVEAALEDLTGKVTPVRGLAHRAGGDIVNRVPGPHPALIVLIGVDGLRKDVFDAALERGLMPCVRRHIVDRGLTIDRVVCTFPSVTPPAAATMLTGALPDRHRIPALAWYDWRSRVARLYTSVRERAINSDLGPGVATLWERLKPAWHVATVGMPIERGADDRWFHVFYPDAVVTRLGLDYIRSPSTRARVLALWYLDVDTASHLGGTLSSKAEHALSVFDRQVGRIVDRIRAIGAYDRTLFVLASDHGSQPTLKNVDVFGELNRAGLGLRTLDLSIDPFFPQVMRRRFAGAPVVGIAVGAGLASLYLGAARGLVDPTAVLHSHPGRRGPIDLVRRLIANDSVDVLMYRVGVDRIRVTGRAGTGEIRIVRRRAAGERLFEYHVTRGGDPLEIPRDLHGRPMAAGEWDRLTATGSRPGAVPGIACFVATGRGGDLAFCARPGYNFSRHFHTRGGYHGGLTAGEMLTRAALAGPGVPRSRLAAASMADLTPTILSLAGVPHAQRGADGRSLVLDAPSRAGPP